jgi:hypothetical protein
MPTDPKSLTNQEGLQRRTPDNTGQQQTGYPTEPWSLATLVSLFGSHRTAYYALWNYLWLVIAATLTASLSIDPLKVPQAATFRYFLAGVFLVYACANGVLLNNTRREMDAVNWAIRERVSPGSPTSTALSAPAFGRVLAAHGVLDALTLFGHAVLIGLIPIATT